jgi:hypothetical protein
VYVIYCIGCENIFKILFSAGAFRSVLLFLFFRKTKLIRINLLQEGKKKKKHFTLQRFEMKNFLAGSRTNNLPRQHANSFDARYFPHKSFSLHIYCMYTVLVTVQHNIILALRIDKSFRGNSSHNTDLVRASTGDEVMKASSFEKCQPNFLFLLTRCINFVRKV